MNGEERERILDRNISEYGIQVEADMAIEEMSELIKAILKWRRATARKDSSNAEIKKCVGDIIEELADVRIMVRQLEKIFRCEADVEREIDYKLKRQNDRICRGSDGRIHGTKEKQDNGQWI